MNRDEGSRLKKFRKTVVGSQEKMSDVIGGTQSSMSDAERGKVRISTDMLRKLMEIYRLNPFWLFFGKPPMQISEAHITYLLSKEEGGDSILYLLTEALGPLSLESSNMVIPVELQGAYVDAVMTKKWNLELLHAVRVVRFPGTSGLYRTFQLPNNHMAPTFSTGDYLCCTPIKSIKEAVNGSLCVVVTKSYGVVAARISVDIPKKKVKLSFDNSLVSSEQILSIKEVLEAWEVKSKVTSNFNNPLEARIKRLEELNGGGEKEED